MAHKTTNRQRKPRMTPQEKEARSADLRWRLARDCQDSGIRAGDLMPSISDLVSRYGATLALARDFYRTLEAEGLVEAVHGKGVFLKRPLDLAGQPRRLDLGIVAYLDFMHPQHHYTRSSGLLTAFERRSVLMGGGSRLFNLFPDLELTERVIETIRAASPDGLLVQLSQPLVDEAVDRLVALEIPLVLADLRSEHAHAVLYDHRTAVEELTRHMVSLGHEKVAFVQQTTNLSWWNEEQLAGFAAGGGEKVFSVSRLPHQDGYDVEIRRLFKQLVSNGFDAVVCTGDAFAGQLLLVARERGVAVPEELAVAGMGDYEKWRPYDLTTAQLSFHELGNACFDLLTEVIERPPAAPVERRLQCPMIVRSSTVAQPFVDIPMPNH